MSESEKPRRRFWRIHLSTALLMMIAAGLMLALNVRVLNSTTSVYGWPQACFYVERTRSYCVLEALALNIEVGLLAVVAVGCLSEWLIRDGEARKT